MQDINYFVLGKKDSPFLLNFMDKYFIKIDSIFKMYFLKDYDKISKKEHYKEFILNPENSSFLIYIDNTKSTFFIERFKKEIAIFLKEGIFSSNLSQNKGSKILNTNIRLTLIDNNPYNTFEAHPEHKKTGGILGWGKKTEKEWFDVYNKSFELLKKIDIGFFWEVNFLIKKIIPLGTAIDTHNSASYRECIGKLYLGYDIGSKNPEIQNLDAIIHEFSHNKLNLILHFDKIILNNYEEKYYSAIRPDARPISGVFLGYHAFAPTMYIVMKAYLSGLIIKDNNLLQKIVLYYIKTKFLQKVIKKYAVLTEIGKNISKEIDYVIVLMDKLFKEINPSKEIILEAKLSQEKHFREVNKNYPNLVY